MLTAAYFYVGLQLPSLLESQPRRVEHVLIAGAGYSILLALLVLAFHAISGVPLTDNPDAGGTIGRGVGGFLITLYLLKNVRRLSAAIRAGRITERPV